MVGLDIVGGVKDMVGGVSDTGRDTLGEVTAGVEGLVVVVVVGGALTTLGARGLREAAVLASMGSHMRE